MKKIYFFAFLFFSFFGLIQSTSFAYTTGATCSFGPQSVVGNSIFWSSVNCTISGTTYYMGSANYVGGSFGSSTCWTNSLNTANYGSTYFYSTSCSGILNSGQTGTGTATNVILSVNQQGLDRSGPQGPIGNTGATGPQGPIGNTGATGATGSFIYNSGAIKGTFDNLQASYDLPQWVLTLHLSSPGDIQGAEEDVIVSGTGMYIASSTPIADPADPRIMMVVKSTETGTGVSCGWYTVTVPPSLVQGTMYANANPDPLTTKFELYGCDGYKTTAPPVYVLQSPETPFTPPSESGSYLALTYKDSTTGATYFDIGSLIYLLVFGSLVIAITYGIYKFLKSIITGKRFF